MPNTQNEVLLNTHLSQALLDLKDNDFEGFLESMRSLGQWVQNEFKITQYKNHAATLAAKLADKQPPAVQSGIRFNQTFPFMVFQNAWQDRSYASMKELHFISRDRRAEKRANACLFIKIDQVPYWRVIPVDADGEEQEALDLSKLDDAAIITSKLPESLVNKQPKDYTTEEQALVHRLFRALKRAKVETLDQRGLTAKAELTKALRHQIKLGLETFKCLFFKDHLLALESGAMPTTDAFDNYRRKLDKKAQQAISHYQTGLQKITRVIGNILAAITAVTYGGVELVATMLGFFVAAGVVWSNPLWAIGGVLLLAGAALLPFPAVWANWKVFSTYVPEFFNKISDEYHEINGKRKKALFWGFALFAFATGIAAGGLAYTSTIALPLMFGFGGMAGIFSPVGILLAAAIAATQTFTLIRSFTNILRKEDSLQTLKAPFLKVNKILTDTGAGWMRRLFTQAMVAGFVVLSALGLTMSCFISTRSVGKLFIDLLQMAPEKALGWGIAIGSVGSFVSRIYFTLDSAIASALILCERLLNGKNKETKLLPISAGKVAVISLDVMSSASFFAQNILSLTQKTPHDLEHDVNLHLSGMAAGPTVLLVTGALLTTGARYAAINIKHIDTPEDPYAEERKKAALKRDEKNKAYYFFAAAKEENKGQNRVETPLPFNPVMSG